MKYLTTFTFSLLLLFASPFALAAKPDCPDPDDLRCNVQHDFKFIFAGEGSIFLENFDGEQPWSVTSPAQELGAIFLGPIPMYAAEIAAIGDAAQPCGITGEFDCANRVGDADFIYPDQLNIAPTGSRHPEYIRLWFGFSLFDESDQTLYEFVAKAFSTGHTVEWDPTQEDFCAHITFERRWVLEYSPADYQRKKQCRESKYFAVCEADDTENQWQGTDDFQMTIWRADHPDYQDPPQPPC